MTTKASPAKRSPAAAAKPSLMQEVNEAQNHVRYARAAVALSLICTAVACGYGSYRLLSDLEAELGYSQYDYVSSSFASIFDNSITEKVSSMQATGYYIQSSCPSNTTWPNCSIPLQDYEYLGQKLLAVAGLEAVVYGPLLTSEQVEPFEKFAYDFFESEGEPTRGVKGFGKGIFTFDPSGSGELIHDVDSSNAKGEWDILIPVFGHTSIVPNSGVVMYNLYSEPTRAAMIDRAIDCADDGDDCLAVSDPLKLLQAEQTRPASLIAIPLRNHGNVVGVTVAVMYWDEIIKDAVPSSADQIHAVLRSSETDEQFTYVFERGELKYIGEGDRSSGDFPDLERTYSIDQFGEGVYSITISPTTAFMDDYQTYAPIVVCFVAVFIILLTSLVFIAYDYFVKTQSQMHDNIMESKRLFVRYISHEIRTPLNTVHLGMKVLYEELCEILKLIENAPDVDAKVESLIDFVMDIDESNDCAVGVLNDLINYDKIVIGSLSLEMGRHDALNLITDTVRPFTVQAYKRKISLNIRTNIFDNNDVDNKEETPSLYIYGDDMKLKQVIRNVVSNALKFTDEEGVITVAVSCSLDEQNLEECLSGSNRSRLYGNILIKVTDTGVGLSAESLAMVGGEYVQINARDLQSGGGSGLGLWISKHIVELHHGAMSFDSDGLGCGTTVSIALPIYKDMIANPESLRCELSRRNRDTIRSKYSDPNLSRFCGLVGPCKISPTESVYTNDEVPFVDGAQCNVNGVTESRFQYSTTGSNGVETILVVDDVASTRKIVVRMLNQAGYKALEAVNGEDCLNVIAKSNKIDLVLMDYEMPVMNGPDATRVISKQWGSQLPVVGLTGNALAQDIEYFESSGAVTVMVKPLNLNLLSTVIDDVNASMQKKEICLE